MDPASLLVSLSTAVALSSAPARLVAPRPALALALRAEGAQVLPAGRDCC